MNAEPAATHARRAAVNEQRALRAYRAMGRQWRRADGSYRRDGPLGRLGAVAHLWPFIRALVATLDLAGTAPVAAGANVSPPTDGFDADAEIAAHLSALERYWDAPDDRPPAYASDSPGTPFGADRYYDDNAWVGLALIQLERMRPGGGHLPRAEQLLQFACAGWDPRGGIFWVEQGRGAGRRNHDRNTVSTAPNAELALHLAELGSAAPYRATVGPAEMLQWVVAVLDCSRGREGEGNGPFWDKLRGDGTVDRALWSYNQGSMVGGCVLLARSGGSSAAGHLAHAEAITRRALAWYGKVGHADQPVAFNAIFFRNLLLLHAETADTALQAEIVTAMLDYADHVWSQMRDEADRLYRPGQRPRLLEQAGMVQVLALSAWDPANYRMLA